MPAKSTTAVTAFKLSRRTALKGIVGSPALIASTTNAQADAKAIVTFTPIAASDADTVRVPPGYTTHVLYRWGDATGIASTPLQNLAFKQDGSATATEAALTAGMHHDGMHYFPINGSAEHGLLAMNHEYTEEVLLHKAGTVYDLEATRKSQNSFGLSVIEVKRGDASAGQNAWHVVRPSPYARRVTMQTPMKVSGPAAGHALLQTSQDPSGARVLGTMHNCANGYTPWGTYLTCEENWYALFGTDQTGVKLSEAQARYDLSNQASPPWYKFDARFDLAKEPNEANRFGWVVELDPFDATSTPIKRTAMGRIKHEGAALSLQPDGRLAYYMGDDAVFEYVYKFVARDKFDAANPRAARDLLDHGTLYAAKFVGDGWAGLQQANAAQGEWLELTHGKNGLTAANGFASQAEVLIHTRRAADVAGATKMDRPEWCAVHPTTREICVALTNNSARGQAGFPRGEGPNPANPRNGNVFGHIVRLREANNAVDATRFAWEFVAFGGDPTLPTDARKGRVKGDIFGSPDGLHYDARGVLWVQTDISPRALNRNDYKGLGNNQLLAVDPNTGEFKRFLTGPTGCEITGCVTTADGKTLFVNIQHPGEGQASSWPDGPGLKPRSATIVVQRADGGVVGT